MRCPNGHEHDKLACPDCLRMKSVIIMRDTIIQRKNFSVMAGCVVCDPLTLAEIADDLGVNKSEMTFPSLCLRQQNKLSEIRRKSKPVAMAEVTCQDCRARLSA